MKDDKIRIKELEFEYLGNNYRYRYDTIEYINEHGLAIELIELPLSITKFANNADDIRVICKIAIQSYQQGLHRGGEIKQKEFREMLGIKD